MLSADTRPQSQAIRPSVSAESNGTDADVETASRTTATLVADAITDFLDSDTGPDTLTEPTAASFSYDASAAS